ncbi:Zinc/iron permease [Saccharata proteae CBS 121410]|uniref:Zinc/iron permease n=1 Tax=Saccharata proteae CBS 121410 TaxID=1314787 RepID=A0A9P4HSR5_9PEZI|nr:Zinc/iron permease [Saccharata proteae CBS 121410]
MWNGLPMLLGLSALMGIASFLAGSLPLSFSMSTRKLRFISALGTGVLVGTSLIVIIPEGIETLYSAGAAPESAGGHTHSNRALSPLQQYPPLGLPVAPASDGNGVDRWTQELRTAERNVEALADLSDPSGWSRAAAAAAPPSTGSDSTSDDPIQEGQPSQTGPGAVLPSQGTKREPHAYVGLSLIFGFILMYLIDVLPAHMSASTGPARPLHISLSNLGSGLHHSPSHSPSLYAADSAPASGTAKSNPPATTIGLVIHAAADGIALGASSTAASTKLGLIIFLAIMVHKAPAAFGLTSVLLKQGLSKRLARTHLLVFSLAAPIGALGTWAAVNVVGRDALGGEEGMQFATGCVLLFSGGTFLYVAMHSMQESTSSHSHPRSRPLSSAGLGLPNGYADHSGLEQGFDNGDKVLGMLVPLVTQVGHAH